MAPSLTSLDDRVGVPPGEDPRSDGGGRYDDESIPRRFERFASERPTQAAVKTQAQTLTFGELNAGANRVARHILTRRERSRHPVALLVEPGAAQAESLLGILKVGRCYAALRTSHPARRLEFILEDSQADLLVTNDRNLPVAIAHRVKDGFRSSISMRSIGDSLATTSTSRSRPTARRASPILRVRRGSRKGSSILIDRRSTWGKPRARPI